MGGRRAFGQTVCVWSLSVFAGGPTGPGSENGVQTAPRGLHRGSPDTWRKRGDWVKGGVGEGKNRWIDGQTDLCTAKDKYTGKGGVSWAEKEEEHRRRRESLKKGRRVGGMEIKRGREEKGGGGELARSTWRFGSGCHHLPADTIARRKSVKPALC